MNRYKIAIANEFLPDRRLFHFPPSRTVGRTVKYIKHCISKDGVFIADNIPEESLNGAIVEISKLYNAPILVKTLKEAQLFSISYSHRHIFPENDIFLGQFFILYDCFEKDLSRKIEPIVTIYTNKDAIQYLLKDPE